MKRRFSEVLYGGKVEWRVLSDDDVLLDTRTAANIRKAWLESANAMKLLAKGKHVKSSGKKHK
jgi:hypothetical protein